MHSLKTWFKYDMNKKARDKPGFFIHVRLVLVRAVEPGGPVIFTYSYRLLFAACFNYLDTHSTEHEG